jgi:hypothetical protein
MLSLDTAMAITLSKPQTLPKSRRRYWDQTTDLPQQIEALFRFEQMLAGNDLPKCTSALCSFLMLNGGTSSPQNYAPHSLEGPERPLYCRGAR